MNTDVFICHSSKDADLAFRVCKYLEEEAGLHCWIAPRNVTGGKLYAEEIVDAIEGTTVFVLIFSSNANLSNHVASEVNCAFNAGKVIIPFCVDDSKMKSIFIYYTNTSHAIMAYPEPPEKFKELKEAVLRNIPELSEELERRRAYTLLSGELGITPEALLSILTKGQNRRRVITYDYSVCYNRKEEEAIEPVLEKLKEAGLTLADITSYYVPGLGLLKMIEDGVSRASGFICLNNSNEDDLMKYTVAIASALGKEMYLYDNGTDSDVDFVDSFAGNMRFDASRVEDFVKALKEHTAGAPAAECDTPVEEEETLTGGYDLIENSDGELMLMIEYRKTGPDNPRIVYDGGEKALMYRNKESSFMLNGITEKARPRLAGVKEILVVEISPASDDIGREYRVPVLIVRSLAALMTEH